jgi:membrane-associated phospholipid phosphatase
MCSYITHIIRTLINTLAENWIYIKIYLLTFSSGLSYFQIFELHTVLYIIVTRVDGKMSEYERVARHQPIICFATFYSFPSGKATNILTRFFWGRKSTSVCASYAILSTNRGGQSDKAGWIGFRSESESELGWADHNESV